MKKMIVASLLCFAGVNLAQAEEVSVPAPTQEEQVIVDTGGSLHYVPKSQAQMQQNNAQQPVQSAPMQVPANTGQPIQSAPMQAPNNTVQPVQPTQPMQQSAPQVPAGVQLTPEQQKMLTNDQKKLLNNVVNPTVPTANQ